MVGVHGGKTAHLMDGTNREGEEEGGFQMSPSKSSPPVTGRSSTRLYLTGSSPPDTTMLTVINTWTDGWDILCVHYSS